MAETAPPLEVEEFTPEQAAVVLRTFADMGRAIRRSSRPNESYMAARLAARAAKATPDPGVALALDQLLRGLAGE